MGMSEELGPITEAMFESKAGGPPWVITEWLESVKRPSDVVFLWAAAGKPLSWIRLTTHTGEGEDEGKDPVKGTPGAKVERLLSPLAHEGRVRLMQAMYDGPAPASALTERTGFRGGALYHHLRELKYAAYIRSEGGKYCLTELGRQLLITMTLIARETIEDQGEAGLAAGAMAFDD